LAQTELKDLKLNFNSHITKIQKEFDMKIREKEKDAVQLTHKIESLSADLQQAVEENGNLEAKVYELESGISKMRAEHL
jgi:seryl-tRNA synthetase